MFRNYIDNLTVEGQQIRARDILVAYLRCWSPTCTRHKLVKQRLETAMRQKRLQTEATEIFREIREELTTATTPSMVDRQNRLDQEMDAMAQGTSPLTEFQLRWDRLLERMEAAGCLPDQNRLFRSYMAKLDRFTLEGIQSQNWGVLG